ncbi:hypothetical protein ACGVWS_06175 [Enterobacteriaceae bacterium LUAb1]
MKVFLAFFILTCSMITDVHGACFDNTTSKKTLINLPPKEMIVSTQSRLYFYSAPDEDCKIKDLFVVSNDYLLAYHESKNFTYAIYLSGENKITSRWVHSNGVTTTTALQNNTKNIININDFLVTYKGKSSILLGSSSKEFNSWAEKNKLKLSDPSLAGIDENNWTVSFNGGYVGLNEVDKSIEGMVNNDSETYLSVFNISGAGFETYRGISIGSSWNDVLDKYGKSKAINDGQSCLSYPYFWMKLTFCKKKQFSGYDRIV